jgi:voltage-gated potassium channel Kch
MAADEIRPPRRALEWSAVFLLAVTALVLGHAGFRDAYPGLPTTELLYRSLQLFALESGALPEERAAPLALEIARILAPAVAGYAVIRAVILLFGEQLALLGLRFVLRDHVVVAGLGGNGFAIAKSFRRAGDRVVVVESDRANEAIPGCRERKIPVLVGDATDKAFLRKARVADARHLFVTAGDNRTNITIAFTAAGLRFRRRRLQLNAFVHLDDVALWRLLSAHVVAVAARLAIRMSFFNVHETAARTLLERHPPFDEAPGRRPRRPHLLVVGMGRLAESVVLYAATMWQRAGPRADEELHVTLAGPETGAQRRVLEDRYPELAALCKLDSWPVAVETLARARAPSSNEKPPFSSVYVCVDEEAEGLAAALAMRSRSDTRNAPIVLAVREEDAGVALALRGDGAPARLEPFGVLTHALAPDVLVSGTAEILALAKHEHYLESERERGVAAARNPSIVPWRDLEESLKESNRMFADSIGAKLEAAGCVVVPSPLADPNDPPFAFSADEVEELAQAEHERWCSDLRQQGWRWGPAKDPTRKLHPNLIPWSDLSEDDRDKDREPIQALPRMLARVGFAIERAEPADSGMVSEPDGAIRTLFGPQAEVER